MSSLAHDLEKFVGVVRDLEKSEREAVERAGKSTKLYADLSDRYRAEVANLANDRNLAEQQRKKAQEERAEALKELDLTKAVLQRSLAALAKAKVAFDAKKVREEIEKEVK